MRNRVSYIFVQKRINNLTKSTLQPQILQKIKKNQSITFRKQQKQPL